MRLQMVHREDADKSTAHRSEDAHTKADRSPGVADGQTETDDEGYKGQPTEDQANVENGCRPRHPHFAQFGDVVIEDRVLLALLAPVKKPGDEHTDRQPQAAADAENRIGVLDELNHILQQIQVKRKLCH